MSATHVPSSLHTITIRGMHCQACIGRIDAAVRKVHGVTDALVTLGPARAKVWSDGPVSETALVKAVESAGAYTVTDITSEALTPAVEHHGTHDAKHAGHAPHHLGGHASHTGHAASALPTPEYAAAAAPDTRPIFVRLYPLFLIVGFITLVAALATSFRAGGNPFVEGLSWSWHAFMLDFMAGFFLVFSFFKLLDLRGFASAYAMYDLLAMRVRPWAFAYPFVELALGIMYLIRLQVPVANIAALVLMIFGALGILNALRQKKQLRCACLGTALNLPMTTVTLVEDLVMAAMAGAMLAWPASA